MVKIGHFHISNQVATGWHEPPLKILIKRVMVEYHGTSIMNFTSWFSNCHQFYLPGKGNGQIFDIPVPNWVANEDFEPTLSLLIGKLLVSLKWPFIIHFNSRFWKSDHICSPGKGNCENFDRSLFSTSRQDLPAWEAGLASAELSVPSQRRPRLRRALYCRRRPIFCDFFIDFRHFFTKFSAPRWRSAPERPRPAFLCPNLRYLCATEWLIVGNFLVG